MQEHRGHHAVPLSLGDALHLAEPEGRHDRAADQVEPVGETVADGLLHHEERHVEADEDLGDQVGIGGDRAPASVRGCEAAGGCPVPEPSRTQFGHWKPTEALTMHSGQIGRSQRVQRMPVSRSGCR